MRRRILIALVGMTLARVGAADPRLDARLDAATAAEVVRLVDAARADGLPGEPLVSKALEGEAKGVAPERILVAVRAQLAALGGARVALGARSSETELVAGAGALLAGVPAESLARLRSTRPDQSLVVPLVVIADLVARRVPTPTAATVVVALTRAGVRDPELMRLRERIERDIGSGTAPASAALARARRLAPGLDQPLDRHPPLGPVRGTTP